MTEKSNILFDKESASALRELAASLGMCITRGPGAGKIGNIKALLVQLADAYQQDRNTVKSAMERIIMLLHPPHFERYMTLPEAEALVRGMNHDETSYRQKDALAADAMKKRLVDKGDEMDNAVRLYNAHKDPFEDMDLSKQHVVIHYDMPGFFVVSGNCPDEEFSTYLPTGGNAEMTLYAGRRIGLNAHGNTLYERTDHLPEWNHLR